MKKILVTTDFSANSKAGVRFAIQLASQIKCELIFYHILETLKSNAWIVNNNNSEEVTFDTKTPLVIFRKTSK